MGMLIFRGPRGSGKTTLLLTLLGADYGRHPFDDWRFYGLGMVVEMNDISTLSVGRRGDHRLPRVAESTSEHIQRSDVVGVRAVVTPDTLKALSSPVFPCHRPTAWACPGGISGINGDETNTVLLRQVYDPCDDLPICPRGNRLTEVLRPTLLLSSFQVIEVLNTDSSHGVPRELFGYLVDIVLPRPRSPQPAFTPRFAASDARADIPGLRTVFVAVGVNQQLVDPDVHRKRASISRRGIWNPNPQRSPTIAKCTTLEQSGSRFAEPMVQASMRFEGNNDRAALNKAGDLEYIIEGALAFL